MALNQDQNAYATAGRNTNPYGPPQAGQGNGPNIQPGPQAGTGTDPNIQTGPPQAGQGNGPNTAQPSWATDPQYAGMDPALKQIYLNSGQTPEGRGTGFADWQYWQGVGPSQYNRLASDIAGTGSDQSTGTPWAQGAWSNSGTSSAPTNSGPSIATLFNQNGISGPFAGSGTDYFNTSLTSGPTPAYLDPNYLAQQGASAADLSAAGFTQGANGKWQGALQENGQGQYIMPNGQAVSGNNLNWLKNQIASYNLQPQTLGSQNQSLLNTLMSRANQSLNIDPTTDSVIQPQVSDYSAAQSRQNRQALNQMAESSSPYATGATNTAATQLAENAAQNTAGLQAQLVQNELTQRRTEIQNALSEQGSLLTSDQQLALQNELGKLDASIQAQSVANQYSLGQGQLNLGQQNINSNNDQFAANYNLNSTNQANYWDALRSGLING